MDPVTGSVLISVIGAIGLISQSLITARTNADRLADKATIAEQAKTIAKQSAEIDRLGGDPDDI